MSFAEDDEILQDFLVEAGEILEKLSGQLVELEKNPQDKELLNAIFRGFHTVKGGAGFLQIDAMVDCCHRTENLFDVLRTGKREVDAELMDITLQALDAVNVMFAQLQEGQSPEPASASLLDALGVLASSGQVVQVTEAVVTKNEAPAEPTDIKTLPGEAAVSEMADDDFAAFVASLDEIPDSVDLSERTVAENSPSSSKLTTNEISDDEFNVLLDALHEKNGVGPVVVPGAESVKTGESNDEIKDHEFEALLDKLHGEGTFRAEIFSAPAKKIIEPRIASPQTVKTPPPPLAPAPARAASIDDKKPESILPKIMPASAVTQTIEEAGEHKTGAIAVENTVRVDTKRLDEIMNMVGELVLVRNRLVRLSDTSSSEAIVKAISNLDVVTGDLQNSVMKTRMQPIKKVFGRFPRVVRDLARNLKKEVALDLVGEETDLDKNLVEALADPLVHLVRNAVDHGIETPDVREKMGKPRQGTVVLAAEQEGDHILLTISDDGAGMDPEKLRAKAVEKGIMEQDAADRLSNTECFELIFAPGFSTKTEVSDVSGRGVGMDVVKTKISQLNGMVSISSSIGKGSRILIKVPLTLAIMPTLMVMLGEHIFALPLANVHEIFNLDVRSTNVVDGQEVVVVRNKAVPLFHLKRWLVKSDAGSVKNNSHVVVVSIGTQLIGFVVDQLIGQEEVVIKPLGKMLIGTPGIAGATITGDGTMALILDVPTLIDHYASRSLEALSVLHENAA